MKSLFSSYLAKPERRALAATVALVLISGFASSGGTTALFVLATAAIWRWIPNPAEESEAAPPVEESLTPHETAVEVASCVETIVELIASKHSGCTDGLSQVQAILDDAVNRLQSNFATLHEHIQKEATFARELADRIARQTSGDHEDSFSNLANHLKEVLESSMQQIVSMSAKSVEIVHRFDDMSASADTMLSLLADAKSIRRETTVLAMNATIEAARAGYHGRTFANVADEVRSLSIKSQAFNDELERLTLRLLKRMGSTRDAISAISDYDLEPAANSTERLNRILGSIEASNEEMAGGLEQLSQSQRSANAQVSEAVMALQFEDLARQRLESIDSEILGITDSTSKALSAIRDTLSSAEPSPNDLRPKLETLRSKIDAIRSTGGESAHIAVAQTDMNDGDIELF